MSRVSVLVPSRNCDYVHQTVESLFNTAYGDIEVIVHLDGWQPERPLAYRTGLEVIHVEKPIGMRHAINNMARLATGEFLLKCDDHTMWALDWDTALKTDMEENWLVTPSRYSLDVPEWRRREKCVEYLTLTYPYENSMYGEGFHGKKWIGKDGIGENMGKEQYFWMENKRRDVKIDDIQTMQGSGWFTTKQHFESIGGLDERHSIFFQEANELCFKTWLSGGAVKVNKNTWYAHWHKTGGNPGMGLTTRQKRETQRFHTWMWMNNKWPKATKTIEWFVDEKCKPAGWPEDWKDRKRDEVNFTVFDPNGKDGFGCMA